MFKISLIEGEGEEKFYDFSEKKSIKKLISKHSHFIKKTFSIGKKNAERNILTSCYNASCHLSTVSEVLISA